VGPRGEHDDVRGFVALLDLTAASERPSPTLNALPMMALQRYVGTPRLAWDFLTLHEPEPWDEYFALVDQPRAAGADFQVGGRRYGLYGHDFRRVPVSPSCSSATRCFAPGSCAATPVPRSRTLEPWRAC
jgi:hypothetical protein